MTDEEAAEAIEIRAEIEETREEMGGTLNELGERLDPGTLMDQAKENVREATVGRVEETAKGISDMVMETIRRNPIPSALAGAGLFMLWKNRAQDGGNGHAMDRRSYYGATSPYGEQGYVGQGQYVGEGAYGGQSQYGGQGQEGMGQKVGETARGAVGQVGQTVGQVGENVGQTVGQVGENVGQTASQIGDQLDRFMQSNPLAVGAIAIGAGALAGSLLPATPQEREMLGDASRQVGSAVRDTVGQATSKAQETMDKAEQQVGSPT